MKRKQVHPSQFEEGKIYHRSGMLGRFFMKHATIWYFSAFNGEVSSLTPREDKEFLEVSEEHYNDLDKRVLKRMSEMEAQ